MSVWLLRGDPTTGHRYCPFFSGGARLEPRTYPPHQQLLSLSSISSIFNPLWPPQPWAIHTSSHSSFVLQLLNSAITEPVPSAHFHMCTLKTIYWTNPGGFFWWIPELYTCLNASHYKCLGLYLLISLTKLFSTCCQLREIWQELVKITTLRNTSKAWVVLGVWS